jgi:hypothetical protein
MQVHERHESDKLTVSIPCCSARVLPRIERNPLMRNTLNESMRKLSVGAALALLSGVSGCSKDDPTDIGGGNPNATVVTLGNFAVQTVKGGGGVTFANSGRYAVIPQFAATQDFATPASTRATVASFPFTIGGSAGVVTNVATIKEPAPSLTVVEAFHMRLRAIEVAEEPRAIANMQALRARPPVSARVQQAAAQADRDFKVLSSLTGGSYSTVTARLVYTGANILLYVDNQSPTTGGFADTEYESFGRQFDTDLFPIDTRSFGPTSDIDRNGKTFVLFTPIVNRLTLSSGTCGSYVAGFFNGADLSGNTSANNAEIFYSAVPGEPAGGPTCQSLGAAIVRRSAPATFIHELQHMISYNQHVLARSASSESVWLNEGLSHMAEELGGKLYESRYPCPNLPPCPVSVGRQSTAQIFPDSAQGFLPPNFGNAYDFFSSRQDYSLTSPTGFGTIEERGVAWLFLRWLVDQKGDGALTQLVQTRNTGTANVEAVSTESFRDLFADFLAATLLDDFPGATTGQISNRHQYPSRNLRAIYARLNSIAAADYPTAYPLDVADLGTQFKLTPTSPVISRTMKPGSLDLFQFTSTAGSAGLVFKPATGTFAANLNAQVTVIRLPN